MITDKELEYLMNLGRKEQEEDKEEEQSLEYWYDKMYKDYHYNVHETVGLKVPYMDKLGDYYLREYNKKHGNKSKSYIKSLKQIRDSNKKVVYIKDSKELESLTRKKIKRIKSEPNY